MMSSDIAGWIRQQAALAGARGLVVGLSGGMDSAVVARLCQIAMPDHVVGVILPCHSDPQDEVDARLVAAHFNIPTTRIDLAPAFDRLIADLSPGMIPVQPSVPDGLANSTTRVSIANVKPRLRMTALYFVANSLNYLVAGTGNRSELTLGYFTKHGDGGVDLLPIGGLVKTDVRKLAHALGVPERIIGKAPTAGLWLGQTDEEEMGFSYTELERYLNEGPETVAPAVAMRIERLIRASEHKRALAPFPE